MIRLTTALLTLGVGMASATATAHGQNECFYSSCNPKRRGVGFHAGQILNAKMFTDNGTIGTQNTITQPH
jgi:hypothetical protein